MTDSPNFRLEQRAPRVRPQGGTAAVVQLENGRQFRARVRRISMTGGLLELDNCVDERATVSLTIYLADAMVSPKAQMLFPMQGGPIFMQPFRFTGLWGEERQILERAIAELLKHPAAAQVNKRAEPTPIRFLLE
ncbi:MAG TPA: hypothetical protein VIW68_05975 [Candidatus Sulfotelmatobacter sp.]